VQQLQQRQQQQQQQQQQQVGVLSAAAAAAAAAAGSDAEAQHGSPGTSTRVVYKVINMLFSFLIGGCACVSVLNLCCCQYAFNSAGCSCKR
jgi:hypothetical protein